MTEKTVTGFPAGEYLRFQKDVVPEVSGKYDLGSQSAPFSTVYSGVYYLSYIPFMSSTTPYSISGRTQDVATLYMADNGVDSGTTSKCKLYCFNPSIASYSSTTLDWTTSLKYGDMQTYTSF